MYKLIYNKLENKILDYINRTTDNSIIPFDPANRDYQEYLSWLEEGNTPEPADETETE